MYEMYSKFYDTFNTNYNLWLSIINSQMPDKSKSIIEFGCGTGNVLKEFADKYEIYGVDISESMLNKAIEKIPNGKFYRQDMIKFESEKKYDLALCLFDSINHILNISDWKLFFIHVKDMLTSKGSFIFDMNTTERLSKISKRSSMVDEIDNNYLRAPLKTR